MRFHSQGVLSLLIVICLVGPMNLYAGRRKRNRNRQQTPPIQHTSSSKPIRSLTCRTPLVILGGAAVATVVIGGYQLAKHSRRDGEEGIDHNSRLDKESARLLDEGKFPCDISGTTSRIKLIMDFHDCEECRTEGRKDMLKATRGKQHILLEGRSPSQTATYTHLHGGENLFLSELTFLYSSALEIDQWHRMNQPNDLFEPLLQEAFLSVLLLSQSPVYQSLKWSTKVPGHRLIKNIRDDALLKNVSLMRIEDPHYRRLAELMQQNFALRDPKEMLLRLGQLFEHTLSTYMQYVGNKSFIRPLQFDGFQEKDLQQFRQAWNDRKNYASRAEGENANQYLQIMHMLAKYRNQAIDKQIALDFCLISESGQDYVVRLGAAHLPPIYTMLRNRIKRSGEVPSAIVQINSSALTHRHMEEIRRRYPQLYQKYNVTNLKQFAALVRKIKALELSGGDNRKRIEELETQLNTYSE